MEQLKQCRHAAVARAHQLQKSLDAKDYGHWSIGVAAALMLTVFCPMSIVVVAAAHWTYSADAHGATVRASASLWTVSASTEIGGQSADSDIDMCGDEMQGFDDCDKIRALRFFTITALLLSLASSSMLLTAFLPMLKDRPWLRAKLLLSGAGLTAVVLLWDFLSMCIAAGVDMGEGYGLNGAGFVFIILELLFVILAVVPLAKQASAQWSKSTIGTPSSTEDEKASHHGRPTLLVGHVTSQSSEKIEKKSEQAQVTNDHLSVPTVVVVGASSNNPTEGTPPALIV